MDGTISNKEIFINIPSKEGNPDGMTVDQEGCLWVAVFGGSVINRYNNKGKKIIIYLSERSEKFSFLINNDNVEFKKFNYNLTFLEKVKLFLFLFNNKVSKIYILTPKSF